MTSFDELNEYERSAKKRKMERLIPVQGLEGDKQEEVERPIQIPRWPMFQEADEKDNVLVEKHKPEKVGLASVKYRFFQKQGKSMLRSSLLLSNLYSRLLKVVRNRKYNNPFKPMKRPALKPHLNLF